MPVTVAPQNVGLPGGAYTPTATLPLPSRPGAQWLSPPGTIAPQNFGLPAPGYYYTPTEPPPAAGASTAGGGEQKPEIDYALLVAGMFGDLGLPDWIQARLIDIFRNTPDATQAAMIALGFIRGTGDAWYNKVFPGIQQGIKSGLFQDERGYRSYVNQVGILYAQYGQGAPSSDTIKGIITEGITPDIVGKRLEGQAYIQAYQGDIQYRLGAFGEGRASQTDLTALGRQQAGLGSPLGYKLDRALAQASQTMQRLFQGTLATPSLSLQSGRLATQAGLARPLDVGA